ncbi:MAG: VTT domain-containing protein [Deltaproteobacteria bacterium]|nr:VTT domain-containing protein [Deltaproteobacteria bacterium]
MKEFLDLLAHLHTPEGIENLIRTGGLLALIAIVFAETGLLIGFFLPGDSLLVTAGVLSSRSLNGGAPILDLWKVNLVLMIAAVLGDQVGFFLGRKTGPKIFDKPDNRFFKKKYALEAHAFYERHGGKAIILARFVPIMRTFVPFIAGVADMSYKHFVTYNVFGGIGWVFSMTMLGYFLGRSPWGEKLHLIILVVVFISILPMAIGILRRLISGPPETAIKQPD